MNGQIDYRTYPILFVDDEQPLIETLRLNYEDDFTVLAATGGTRALQLVTSQPVAILVVDQRMPEMSGVELIKRALDIKPDLIPIILTGYTDVETLVDAINLGRIYRFIPKPFDGRELRMALQSAIETFHLARENVRLADENRHLVEDLRAANERLSRENGYFKKREAEESGFHTIFGRSEAIQHVFALARRVLATSTTVLLEGPTGTGKELVARAIHHEGSRREKLFVPQNCGALNETLLTSELFGHRRGSFTGAIADKKGLFEIADGGTLFLDEIAETSPVGAARPTRVDVRVIAATNRDLAAEVQKGRFREDLYFRLNVFRIRIPSLHDRREDIPMLAAHFLEKHSLALGHHIAGITPIDALTRLDYPGNVRELEHMIERAILLCEPGSYVTETELLDGYADSVAAPADAARASLQDDVTRFESERIALALERCDGNRTHAARDLGLTYRGLLKKMQRFGLLAAAGKRLDGSSPPEEGSR